MIVARALPTNKHVTQMSKVIGTIDRLESRGDVPLFSSL